eukprot:TRINITY_DN10485_c0_g1_i1.p1 TRINITY_DN10485_c0_g1~~TRINITY_DN10485_c0_g1_i1.p1  ORF type:complete len:230 (+),score=101.60 TRINITY_DN10485_c0_g1_i1:168-857(+)
MEKNDDCSDVPVQLMTRKRSHSTAHPAKPIHHEDGLEYLLYRLGKVGDEEGYISKEQFVETVEDVVDQHYESHMPMEEQHAQLYEVFTTLQGRVGRTDGRVKMSTLIAGLHVILEGKDEEKIRFAFRGLDKNGDGKITKEEFLAFFHHYFLAKVHLEGCGHLSEERWKVISNHLGTTFSASDTNKDGSIDINEFMHAVKHDPDHPFCLVLDSFTSITAPLKSPRRLSNH